MVLNAAVQMLREAEELKQKIAKFKSGTSMLQERSLWATQQQLQKIYQKVLVLDLDYALDKKVEQDLWNIGFKQQIEALQAISKDRKNAQRSDGQAMLSWVLQAAAGFYLCLLHQICTTFQLDLPFRRRASLLGWVEGWGATETGRGPATPPPPAAARYICQHCLVHLGDLARYRQQLRVAHTFYRHALVVSAHSGQPYNQLALVAWRRGRRLGALYWHVRSLLVRAPFPPAPANLARTLRAAAASQGRDLPVLPGVAVASEPAPAPAPGRLDAHSYVTELIRALHFIHTVEELDTASSLVNSLNSSLTALIATDSFETMTLIKMACVLIWAVDSATEGLRVQGGALSEAEGAAAELGCALAAAALLALLLPAYSAHAPPQRALPALKVWLQWVVLHPPIMRTSAWTSRPALWPALAHTLNLLAPCVAQLQAQRDSYETIPLPEDEELHGFLPLEQEFKGLRFPNHATWDTYGGRIPDLEDQDNTECESAMEALPQCLSKEPELERRVRALRLVRLGRRLAALRPEHFSFTEENDVVTFTAAAVGGEQLSLALAELSAARGEGAGEGEGSGGGGADAEGEGEGDGEGDSEEEEERAPPPPVIISEADFREKVREKRVGILKPQGSLERAREERALASTQEEQEPECSEEAKGDDKKEARKPRVNIAMAAIMRKQEETNKQVKFVTPPPTPDSTVDNGEAKEDKPKIIQPKAVKSLANLPIGRKTGGILSLKDKSAGYPHLVNTDPEPTKKTDKDEKKDPKPNQVNSSQSQSYQQKRLEQPPSPSWGTNMPPPNFNDQSRMNFQKNYGIQNAGISFNPSYQSNVNNQGIRLPVVNPKEIDVRTAALQKQSSRQELFQDGNKFGNQNYPLSSDKKNFLQDLPPRFANQYRYWQSAQENQFNDNKFRDDTFKSNSLFNNQEAHTSWMNTPQVPPENYQQPMSWWKPESPQYNYSTPPLNVQPNFYSMNSSNPYPTMPTFNPAQNNMGQNSENLNQPNYMQSAIGQPQLSLQSLVTPPNFNSSLNNFNYAPAVGYDSSMYPQFSNKLGFQPVQVPKPPVNYQGNKDLVDMGMGFGSNVLDMQSRSLNVNFSEPMNNMGVKNLEQIPKVEPPASTYSLFSGADPAAWGAPRHAAPHQSLWSGPGPSPLERLLEQQKQMKQPPNPQ